MTMQESEKIVRKELEHVTNMLCKLVKDALANNIQLDSDLMGWISQINDIDGQNMAKEAKRIASQNAQAAQNAKAYANYRMINVKPKPSVVKMKEISPNNA